MTSTALWLEVPGDLYRALGLNPAATEAEIHRAWRSAAKDAHPDRGGDAAAFRTIHVAYLVLSDPHERAIYDRYRQAQHALAQSRAHRPTQTTATTKPTSSQATSAVPRSPYERPLLLWLMALAALIAVVGSYIWPGFTILTGIAVGVVVLSRYHHMGFGLLRRR